jgi:predicted lipoprotein with Yx(FWY)xxD motif
MHFSRALAFAGIFILVVLAGCGDSNSSVAASFTATLPPSTLHTTIGITDAFVSNSRAPVLTDLHGKTLYYFSADTATSSACTGSCLTIWQPLTIVSGQPTGEAGLPGKLTVLADSAGNQVEYNGHPLYTYAQDKNLGDATGEGVDGKWHVATPTLAAQ